MPEYIAKLRTTVRISQPGQVPVEGLVSLAPQAEFHDGPETILERLNTRDRVIPFQRREDAGMLMLSRIDIEWVTPGRGIDPGLVCPPTHLVTHEERVRVLFRSGGEMDGVIRMELPEHLNRASDFLNGDDDFFPLITPHGTYLINKLQVIETRVFSSTPLPVTLNPSHDLIG